MTVTKEIAQKVLETVQAGLVQGLGKPIPGQMCVEAAVCYAYGLPHSDNPPCVGPDVRGFKIVLNDCPRWGSSAARAKGMLRLAIAQLGSVEIDQDKFKAIVARETIKQIVPIAFENAARYIPKHADKLRNAGKRCADEGTSQVALDAMRVIDQITAEDDVERGHALYLALVVAETLSTRTCAAHAAVYTTRNSSDPIQVLTLSAEIAVQALIELKSPGCQFLYLCDQS